MNAQELRISNHYKPDFDSYEMITAEDLIILCNSQVDDYYQPIKLSHSILLECGFVFNVRLNFYEWLTDEFYSLEFDGDNYKPYEIDNVIQFKLKYLHELENIFYCYTKRELITKYLCFP